jgi:hypothetical protein
MMQPDCSLFQNLNLLPLTRVHTNQLRERLYWEEFVSVWIQLVGCMVSWAQHTMEEIFRIPFLIASLLLFLICIFVNFSTVFSLLIRPSLRSTLNNLCCAILLTNILFGCSEFFIHAVKLFGANLISEDYLCSSLTIIPQCYRIVSLYLILGSLFLRSV